MGPPPIQAREATTGVLGHSPRLGRVIRQDADTDLGVPTRVALEAAVRDGDSAEAER